MWLGFNWGFPSCPKGVYCSRRFAPIGASGERREMVKTPKEALALAKERGATMVDLKFMDFVGLWKNFTPPIQEIKEEIFEEGLRFDGSSKISSLISWIGVVKCCQRPTKSMNFKSTIVAPRSLEIK